MKALWFFNTYKCIICTIENFNRIETTSCIIITIYNWFNKKKGTLSCGNVCNVKGQKETNYVDFVVTISFLGDLNNETKNKGDFKRITK